MKIEYENFRIAIRNQKVSQELSYKFVKGKSDTSIMGRASFRNKKMKNDVLLLTFRVAKSVEV